MAKPKKTPAKKEVSPNKKAKEIQAEIVSEVPGLVDPKFVDQFSSLDELVCDDN